MTLVTTLFKTFIILLCVILCIGCTADEKAEAHVFNGIMIDCSRLVEQHDYYFRLIDYMSEWGMNTLILHFSDDHGLSIQLPGYEHIAAPFAFSVEDIQSLVTYADSVGIDVIPELEVFGHTRYITDHPDYQHLGLKDHKDQLAFNAINPLHPETLALLGSLIREVSFLFPSKYIHLGCDEVDLSGLDENSLEEKVWADHVNAMSDTVRANGKIPMIWNDHVRKDSLIAAYLDKDVILLEWNYDPDYKPSSIPMLREAGLEKIIMAPSLACYRHRVLPSDLALKNTEAMIQTVRDGQSMGLINTIWLPQRYLQNSMWYGIAYTAYLMDTNAPVVRSEFHKLFVERLWGVQLTNDLDAFLTNWTKLHIHRSFFIKAAKHDYTYSDQQVAELRSVLELSQTTRNNLPRVQLDQNEDIFETMVLAVRVMEALCQSLLYLDSTNEATIDNEQIEEDLSSVIAAVGREWDRGRYPADPQKYQPKFSNIAHSHLLVLLKQIHADLAASKL